MAEDADPAQLIAEGRIEELLLQIRRGAEREERVAALRPSWRDLVPLLVMFRETLHRSVLEPVSDVLAPFQLRPAADASAFSVGATIRAASQLDPAHALVEEQILSYGGAISDHLWGLAAAMSADPPVRPALVIGRVLLDAGAHLHYLTDPAISGSERTIRAANIRLSALYDEMQDFDDDHEGAARVKGEINLLLTAAEADGFRLMSRRRGLPQRCLEPRLPSTGQLASDLLGPLGPTAWRTLSSTVHAQDRPVLDLSTGRGIVATTVQGRSQAALQLGASVIMCTEAVGRTNRFRGIETTISDRAAEQLNTVWQAAAGLNDAQYASQVD